METLSRLVLTFLLNALWQVILATALAAIAVRLLQRAPARYRHVPWVMGLAISLLLPLASLPESGTLLRQPVKVASVTPQEAAPLTPAPQCAPNIAGDSSLGTRSRFGLVLQNLLRRRTRPIAFSPLVAHAVSSIYLLSLLYYLTRLARAWSRTRRLRRTTRSCALPPKMEALVAQCRTELGLRDVAIRGSAEVAGPATVGVLRPVIILPEALLGKPPSDELATALCHEMAHICRRDYLLNLICEFTLFIQESLYSSVLNNAIPCVLDSEEHYR